MFEAFGRKYTGPNEDQSPPRRVTVDLKDLTNKLPENCRSQITIIQDATEKDSIAEPDKTAESLLINELNQIAHGNDEQVYICCVNRGILAQSYTEAQLDSKFKKTVELLTEITNSVTSGPLAGSCWPLDKYSSVIAWPMDMDTLVSEESGNKQKSVLHQIIDQITKHPSWKNCESGEMCPFCTNKKVLSESQNIDNLSSLLRAFELGTGKRWTFRDLYSLISFILVGSEEELVIGGTQFSPCEWTAKQLSLMESSRKSDDIERARSLYRIASCLYWHRLFPLWPRLATREFLESRKKLTGGIGNQAAAVEDLFKFLQWRGRDMKAESISRTITSKLCPLLDPANCKPDVTISYATTRNYTVKDLDESFSISVGQGLDLVKRRILPIENQILQRLAAADDRLSSEHISNQDKLKAERLQTTIRLFACRMVKRSIGTRNGVHCKLDSLTSYRAALDDSKILKNVQIRLRTLINDEQRNIFSVPMTTTFAQPAPPTKRNLILECQKVKVKGWKTQDTERPKAQIAYLNVDDAPVPLTFELYDALQNLDKGMHSGSLNDEVFAMIDRIRSKVAGRVVRDAEALDEDALLLLEGTGEVIRYSDEEFNISNIDEV